MNLTDRIKSRVRPVAQYLIGRMLRDRPFMNHLLSEWACREGWRPRDLDADYARASFGYDDEDEIKRAVAVVRHGTMISFDRLATLWHQVRHFDNYQLPGDLVECGVWRGGAAAMMALAHLGSGSTPWRHIHLFDSWQGLPEPNESRDGSVAVEYSGGASGGALTPVGKCVASLGEARQLLERKVGYPKGLIHYHVGWFQNTLPRTELGKIALLRLDGDWYESTKLCLEHLYPQVIKGGVVILDDYACWKGCRDATNEFLGRLTEPIMLHHIDNVARYFIKP